MLGHPTGKDSQHLQRLHPATFGTSRRSTSSGACDAARQFCTPSNESLRTHNWSQHRQRPKGHRQNLGARVSQGTAVCTRSGLETCLRSTLPVTMVLIASTPGLAQCADDAESCNSHIQIWVCNSCGQCRTKLSVMRLKPSTHRPHKGFKKHERRTPMSCRILTNHLCDSAKKLLPQLASVHGVRLAQGIACLSKCMLHNAFAAEREALKKGRLESALIALRQFRPVLRYSPSEKGGCELPLGWRGGQPRLLHQRSEHVGALR
mmetsp:Transcript_36505/g.97211  ORF Transcript_36505/g.97211 Transcript_36505/m.97211 type:complete len:263 (+) Transcript_36505:1716-2504(+)